MALNLKQKKKCHIVAPEWLTVGASRLACCVLVLQAAIETRFVCSSAEYLQGKITQETTQAEFTKLPFRFAEISRVLLDGYAF
jgi:GINS complex subunit 2